MSVLIIDSETDRIVRELATRTGTTPAEAVKAAAEERLARLAAPPRKEGIDVDRLEKILAQIRSYPLANEHLTDDEIIGYDENGVPS